MAKGDKRDLSDSGRAAQNLANRAAKVRAGQRQPGQAPNEPQFAPGMTRVFANRVVSRSGPHIRLEGGKFAFLDAQRHLASAPKKAIQVDSSLEGKVFLRLPAQFTANPQVGDTILVYKTADGYFWGTVANYVCAFPIAESPFRSVAVDGLIVWRGYNLPGGEWSGFQTVLTAESLVISENIGTPENQIWVPMLDREQGAKWLAVNLVRSARKALGMPNQDLTPQQMGQAIEAIMNGIAMLEAEAAIGDFLSKNAESGIAIREQVQAKVVEVTTPAVQPAVMAKKPLPVKPQPAASADNVLDADVARVINTLYSDAINSNFASLASDDQAKLRADVIARLNRKGGRPTFTEVKNLLESLAGNILAANKSEAIRAAKAEADADRQAAEELVAMEAAEFADDIEATRHQGEKMVVAGVTFNGVPLTENVLADMALA